MQTWIYPRISWDTSKKYRCWVLLPNVFNQNLQKCQKNIYKISLYLDNWPIIALLILKKKFYTDLLWLEFMFHNYVKFKCNLLLFGSKRNLDENFFPMDLRAVWLCISWQLPWTLPLQWEVRSIDHIPFPWGNTL